MSAPLSSIYPGMSGGIESVTGSKVVDTGLTDILTCDATLMTVVAANEESHVVAIKSQNPGENVKLTLTVTKGGTASGTAGDSAVDVAWWALKA